MKMVMGVITIIVAAILLPVIFTAVGTITSANITNFTGLSSIVSISALVIVVMVMFSGGYMTYSAAKGGSTGKGELMNVIYGILTLFIGLTLFPIIITQFNTLYPLAAAFTGAKEIVAIFPLLIYIGFVFGGGWLLARGSGIRHGKGKKHSVKAY